MSICSCYLENKEADEYVTGGGKKNRDDQFRNTKF